MFFCGLFVSTFAHTIILTDQEEDDEDDESFDGDESGEEGESLGSVDTDIEEDEVEDLQADAEEFEDMPTARKSTTPKKAAPKATPKKAASVDDLSTKMSTMKVSKVEYFSFDWRFPMAMYSVHEGNTKKIYVEILQGVQIPPEYILHAKVLPGGKQFSLLCGVPRYMYEETYMKRRMGQHHTKSSAIFQAFDRFVIQPVLRLFPENSSHVHGSPQIIQLEEECIEGPVPFIIGNAKATGVPKIQDKHRQFQVLMTFELTCVHKLQTKVAKPQTVVWGSMNSSSDDDSDNDDDMEGKNDNNEEY